MIPQRHLDGAYLTYRGNKINYILWAVHFEKCAECKTISLVQLGASSRLRRELSTSHSVTKVYPLSITLNHRLTVSKINNWNEIHNRNNIMLDFFQLHRRITRFDGADLKKVILLDWYLKFLIHTSNYIL